MKKIILLFGFLFSSPGLFAQIEKTSDLYKTILAKDSLLFNIGFNTCDIAQFENLISDDFEFYHDQHGITPSKISFISSIKDGLCKMDYKPKRVLQENTTEVFTLKENGILYGVIQTGIHNFYAIEKDNSEYITSIAKFTHVWLLENNTWKISKGLSYDHQDFEEPINDALLFKDKTETERWLKLEQIPALGIAFIENEEIQTINVYGTLNNGQEAPINSLFNVASLTKPVTAIVALKLASTGKWNIDEPIYKYYLDPDLKTDQRAKELTTRHILSHQTGFPNWRWNTETGLLAFEFHPGMKYQYSGEGFEILRKALENKFNKSLNELAKELIFVPLKMENTNFFWNEQTDEELFVGNFDAEGKKYELGKYDSSNGADDLLTTVEDYGKFLISVMNGNGISKAVFKDMTTPQVQTKNRKHFGLGFEIYEFKDGDYALSHGGSDKGVQTLIFMFPESKKGLIIFTNVDDGYKVFTKLIEYYLGNIGKEIIEIETSK